MPEPTPAPVAHACPPKGSGVMPCCGRTPFEVPRTDRISIDPFEVTCGQPTPVPVPADVRDQIAAALYEWGCQPHLWADAHPDDRLAYVADADAVLRVPAIAQALQAEDLLCVARDTSNRSEAARAQAVAELLEWKKLVQKFREKTAAHWAALERVQAECDRIEAAVRANPQAPDFDGAYLAAIGHIRAALNPQEPS